MSKASPSSIVNGFNPYIHGLRGFAAALVCLCHIYAGAVSAGIWPFPASMAHPSAIFLYIHYIIFTFFMVSGCLITSSLLRHNNLKHFALDRLIRIYPVFLVILIPIFIVGPIIHYKWMADLTTVTWTLNFLSNLFLLPGIFHLPIAQIVAWTLSYEAAFYLVAMVLFYLSRWLNWRWILAGALLVGVFCFFTLTIALPIFIGVTAYFILDRFPQFAQRFSGLPLLSMLLYFLILYVPLSAWIEGRHHTDFFVLLSLPVGLWFFLTICLGKGWFSRWLCQPIWQFYGDICYSFYLWHTIILFVTKPFTHQYLIPILGPNWGVITYGVISFLLATFISTISYRVIEVRLGKYLKSVVKQRYLQTSVQATA